MLGLKESLSLAKVEALLNFSPRQLGRLLNAEGMGQCPRHPGTEGATTVHEYGVQFPCGCCRRLPPLHRSDRELAYCGRCNPVEESNVIPLRRPSRRLTGSEVISLRRQVGLL